jgi:hypothetical protein
LLEAGSFAEFSDRLESIGVVARSDADLADPAETSSSPGDFIFFFSPIHHSPSTSVGTR